MIHSPSGMAPGPADHVSGRCLIWPERHGLRSSRLLRAPGSDDECAAPKKECTSSHSVNTQPRLIRVLALHDRYLPHGRNPNQNGACGFG